MAKRENGKSWFDIIFASAALVVSGVSLWVAIGTEDANRKMVAAAVWPIVQISDSNASADASRSELRFTIMNSGVGPAQIASFELYWRGRAMKSSTDLLSNCCGWQRPAGLVGTASPKTVSTVANTVLRAGEMRDFLAFRQTEVTQAAWAKLDAGRQRGDIGYRICYCSVFDDCWLADWRAAAGKPQPVKMCPAAPVVYQN